MEPSLKQYLENMAYQHFVQPVQPKVDEWIRDIEEMTQPENSTSTQPESSTLSLFQMPWEKASEESKSDLRFLIDMGDEVVDTEAGYKLPFNIFGLGTLLDLHQETINNSSRTVNLLKTWSEKAPRKNQTVGVLLFCLKVLGGRIGDKLSQQLKRDFENWKKVHETAPISTLTADIYISYCDQSETDKEIMRIFLEELENKQQFSGITVGSNCADSFDQIKSSRHTLALLSNHYLNDSHCMAELRTAATLTEQSSYPRLIPVKIETSLRDTPGCLIRLKIGDYQSSKRSNKAFWDTLFKSLTPRSSLLSPSRR